MLLVIASKEYDLKTALSEPSLNDLYFLQSKTISPEFPRGISLPTLGRELKRFQNVENPMELLEDATSLMLLRAVIFLCRRWSGDRVTLEEANDFPIAQLAFVKEDGDEELIQSADPHSALTDSAQGDDTPPARPTNSKTSKRRSTNGSASSPTTGQE